MTTTTAVQDYQLNLYLKGRFCKTRTLARKSSPLKITGRKRSKEGTTSEKFTEHKKGNFWKRTTGILQTGITEDIEKTYKGVVKFKRDGFQPLYKEVPHEHR